ncbi:hypothetical protein CDAR_385221 [Caerostris darwini]|uniref:Uncharacterized protein n=1 Tax=Caerostris darwini TaxID=1538125 RepID=A0AAV4UIY4_9ARAC|nr:hypothetical protein CDAR_385221 [Caerostris darwini]
MSSSGPHPTSTEHLLCTHVSVNIPAPQCDPRRNSITRLASPNKFRGIKRFGRRESVCGHCSGYVPLMACALTHSGCVRAAMPLYTFVGETILRGSKCATVRFIEINLGFTSHAFSNTATSSLSIAF